MAEKNYDYDFIGFTYNGKHSIKDLNIYRTSDGNRYNETINPSINDKTIENTNGEMSMLVSSYYKTRSLSIPFAYDGLSREQINELKKVFDGKGVHDLIFDEHPYKVYKAKVAGTPTLKFIPFDIDGKEIFRGEGSISFTCYEPFAFLRDEENIERTVQSNEEIVCGPYQFVRDGHDWSGPEPNLIVYFDLPKDAKLPLTYRVSFKTNRAQTVWFNFAASGYTQSFQLQGDGEYHEFEVTIPEDHWYLQSVGLNYFNNIDLFQYEHYSTTTDVEAKDFYFVEAKTTNDLEANLWLEPGQYLLSVGAGATPWSITTSDGGKIDATKADGEYYITLTTLTRIAFVNTEQDLTGKKIELILVEEGGINTIDGTTIASKGTYTCKQCEFSFYSGNTEYHSNNKTIVLDRAIIVDAIGLDAESEGAASLGVSDTDIRTVVAICDGVQLIAPDKQCVNGYSLYDYPTRDEWACATNAPLMKFNCGRNYGDDSASFVITKNHVNAGDEIRLYSNNDGAPYHKGIIVEETCDDFEWNSETGMVSGIVKGETRRRAIKFKGNSRLLIPAGEDWSAYFSVLREQDYLIKQITKLY